MPKLLKESLSVRSMLKTEHKIIGVADDNHITLRHFLAPDLDP
jgi:hypothetical protein